MAIDIISTFRREPKASSFFAHTSVSRHTMQMLGQLITYIECERDLEHAGSFDPALDQWFTDAEAARTRLLDTLADLQATSAERPEDPPLKRIGLITLRLIESDNAETFAHLLRIPELHPDLFSCAGNNPLTRRVNLMIGAALDRLNDLARLSEHADAIEEDDAVTDEVVLATAA